MCTYFKRHAPKVLLVTQMAIMPYREQSFTEVEAFHKKPFSEADWPSDTQADKGKWQEVTSVTDDSAYPTGSSTATLEDSQKHATINIPENFDAGIRQISLLEKKGLNVFLPLAVRKVRLSVAILFFMSLLALYLNYQTRFKKAQITLEAKKAEEIAEDQLPAKLGIGAPITERLRKVKALLPAAERLASAVATAKSRKLLTRVQELIRATDPATSTADNRKLKRDLEKALGALRRLREAAVEEGNKMLQAEEYLYPILPLDCLTKDFAAHLAGDEIISYIQDGFFVKSYQGVYESAARLRKRFSDARRRLTADQRFENEEDEEALIDAALVLESLGTTRQELQRLRGSSTALREFSEYGTRALLALQREQTAVTLEAGLDVHRLYVFLATGTLENISHSAAHSSLVDKLKAALISMKADLEQAELLLEQVKAEVLALRNCHSMPPAVKAAQRADALNAQAKKLLLRCASKREAFTDLELRLNLTGRRMLNEIAKKSVNKIKSINERLRLLKTHVESRFARQSKDLRTKRDSTAQYLGLDLTNKLVQAVNETVNDGDAWVREVTALQKNVESLDTMTAVLKDMSSLRDLVRNQVVESAVAHVCMLRLYLVELFKDEIEHLTQQVALAGLHSFHLKNFEKEKYTKAKDLFNAAKNAAAEARNLPEVIDAVGAMRSHAITMGDTLYRYKTGDSQPE